MTENKAEYEALPQYSMSLVIPHYLLEELVGRWVREKVLQGGPGADIVIGLDATIETPGVAGTSLVVTMPSSSTVPAEIVMDSDNLTAMVQFNLDRWQESFLGMVPTVTSVLWDHDLCLVVMLSLEDDVAKEKLAEEAGT